MSAAGDQPGSGDLQAARKAVATALLDANVNVIFGSPVDTAALPDYLNIVENPKDLGTILQDIDKSLQGSGPYKSAIDVLNDVQLVWANCLKYNDRPEDKSIVDICHRSAKLFNKEWKKAGLAKLSQGGSHAQLQGMDETTTSMGGNDRESEPLPLRLLTNFEVALASDPSTLRSLDTLGQERAAGGSFYISGELIPVGGSSSSEVSQPLAPEAIVDWVAEYSGPETVVWVVTDEAWYKLLDPSDRYSSLFRDSMQGVALAREALEEIAAGEDATSIPALIDRLAATLAAPEAPGGPVSVSKEAKDFAVIHVETKLGRRKPRSKAGRKRRGSGLPGSALGKRPRGGGFGKSASRSRLGLGGDTVEDHGGFYIGDEIDSISDDDMPEDFEISEEEATAAVAAAAEAGEGIAEGDAVSRARRKAWRKFKYWTRRMEEEKKQRIVEEKLQAEEQAADEARGPPPAATASSRLPLKCLPDLLMVWEFCQSFGDVLQLPPFSLTVLEAALDPGPRVREGDRTSAPAADGDADGDGDGQGEDLEMVVKQPAEEKEEDNEDGDVKMEPVDAAVQKEEEVIGKAEAIAGGGGEGAGAVAESERMEQQPEQMEVDTKEEEVLATGGAPAVVGSEEEGQPLPTASGDETKPTLKVQGFKVAPQNVLSDPTVKTRRQLGIEPSPSEKALALTDESVPSPADKSVSKIKLKLPAAAAAASDAEAQQQEGEAAGAGDASNPVAAALSAAQAAQDAYAAMLHNKYGLDADFVASHSAIDRESAASGLLLRDLVSSLASAAAGVLPGAVVGGQPQPRVAKMQNPDAEHPSWPERLANTVWGAVSSPPEARQAALKLAYGDYLDLAPEERLTLLVALTHAAINSEAMIGEITMRVDQFGLSTTRRDGGAGDELDDEGGRLASAAATAAAVAPPPPPPPAVAAVPADGAAEEPSAAPAGPPAPSHLDIWQRWYSAQNLGIRRPLGQDFRGRRYWAFGRQSGAFRIFCEEADMETWGWYEGEAVQPLITWLASAKVRCEAPLIKVLRAAPLPTSSTTSNAPARHLSGAELLTLRSDGYRGLTLPLLRGEWNSRREGSGAQPPSMEQRIPLAVDVMLGSIPSWFKGEIVQRHIMAISDVLAAAHYGRDAARALLETERLLAAEGKLSREWADIWQGPWRRIVASMVDLRDAPLCTAALQAHVQTAPDIIPRPAFMKIATETSFVLTIPALGDTVIVLRAGLLRHIDRYMQIIGVSDIPEGQQAVATGIASGAAAGESHGDASMKEGGRTEDDEEGTAGGDQDDDDEEEEDEEGPSKPQMGMASAATGSGTAATPSRRGFALRRAPPRPPPKIKPSAVPKVKADWEKLRARAAALRPAERYVVRTIVYRRHLADIADCDIDETNETAPKAPVAWVFLRPARFGPRQQLPTQDIVLPVAIVTGLPDYLLKVDAYVQGTRVSWQAGDRFRMFFGGKISEKTLRKVKAGGTWHRGEVVAVEPMAPGRFASLEEKERYDPWESVVVRWDHLAEDYLDRVNPWELEIDPDEETRRGDEARRQQQAAARAQRARASARRAVDDPEYAAQAAQWAEEDAKLAGLAAQVERANLLLSIHKSKPEPEEAHFNDAAYGTTALHQQQILMATLGAPTLMAHHAMFNAAAAAAMSKAGAASGQAVLPGIPGAGAQAGVLAGMPPPIPASTRSGGPVAPPAPTTNIVPNGPLKPGQEVPPKVLEALRTLNSQQFTMLLTNFYRGLKGKFKVPVFAHKELDLHAVWWAVMDRGGYESVTAAKQWRDICRALPELDLSGQTSASYNMRLNYERCLLDFENYLACGQYEADVAAGRAPLHTQLTDPVVTKFTIPGAYPPPQQQQQQQQGIAEAPAAAAAAPAAPPARKLEPISLKLPSASAAASAPATQTLGTKLQQSGTAAIGRIVQRYWPEEGGWWDAKVTDFNPATKEHQLTYNAGNADESFEWVNLTELSDSEFRDKKDAEQPAAAVLPMDTT